MMVGATTRAINTFTSGQYPPGYGTMDTWRRGTHTHPVSHTRLGTDPQPPRQRGTRTSNDGYVANSDSASARRS